jgi:hypothetical protein
VALAYMPLLNFSYLLVGSHAIVDYSENWILGSGRVGWLCELVNDLPHPLAERQTATSLKKLDYSVPVRRAPP